MPESKFVMLEGAVHGWLVRHSMGFLRVTVGLVFLGFGVLKFFPGASPAQDLVVSTTRILTFGLVPDAVALVLVATLECVIGLSLILNRGLRVTIYLLAGELVGILSPVVLLTDRLFPGSAHLPTLEAQYVLKDIVLVGAAMVIATTFRGARIKLAVRTGEKEKGGNGPESFPIVRAVRPVGVGAFGGVTGVRTDQLLEIPSDHGTVPSAGRPCR